MDKKSSLIINIILTISILLLSSILLGAFYDTKDELNYKYDLMVEASLHSKKCMEEIKDYRIELGLEINKEDILETGMIGSKKRTNITTTEGEIEAKRTSTNPNWTAVYINYFMKAGLKEGDEVALIFSGSFPALNIMAIVACDYYNLNYVIMSSVGASYYGANEIELPFYKMADRLYKKGLIKHNIDYISLGGDLDIGSSFRGENTINDLEEDIKKLDSEYIYIEDFNENILKRIELLDNLLPNMKMLISVGGTQVALGIGSLSYLEVGYKKGNTTYSLKKRENNTGLIEYYKNRGVDVVSMLQIKYLSSLYNIEFDSSSVPIIGKDSNINVYFKSRYKIVYMVLGLIVFTLTISSLYIFRKKYIKYDIKKKCFIK